MIFENLQSVEEFHHQCQDHLEMRERTIGKGTAYVMQCTFCGYQKGQSAPKKTVAMKLQPFDVNLSDTFDSKRIEVGDEFLPKPKSMRDPININDLFEQKIDSSIDEFLSESTSLHKTDKATLINTYLTRKSDQYHNQQRSDWKSELQIKEWFSQTFSQWFHIYPEVRGIGFINGRQKTIIIDFVIVAKPKLI